MRRCRNASRTYWRSMVVSLDISTKPNFVRPKLLLHPSIPLALSGVNPRTIKGQEWWDVVRKQVYRWNNYCCWACGEYQLDALYKQTLDAHETYTYDYKKFEAYPGEVVALCRACHLFIHWRRVKSYTVRKEVVIRGLNILADAGLPVPYWQHKLAKKASLFHRDWQWGKEAYPDLKMLEKIDMKLLSAKWVLVMDGLRYNIGGVK